MVPMHSVTSSDIAALGYDDSTSTLYVRFHQGRLYSYDRVPRSVYEALNSAPSIGSSFHANVRYVYAYRRLQ